MIPDSFYEEPVIRAAVGVKVGTRSAYLQLSEGGIEHYTIADAALVGEPGAWQLLDALYDRRGPDIRLQAASEKTFRVAYRYEGQWRTLRGVWRRAPGLREAIKRIDD